MMIPSSREEEIPTKEEANANDGRISSKVASSSSTPWLRFKDPRIVRVSRAFGGKDRHSKVCTVRGLRDRRVRLSVPTAIQLYDLQDRLGLNQPSKVVDWLLDVAKDEINKLPPLQIPPGNFPSGNFPTSSRELNSSKAKSKEVIARDMTKGSEGEGNQGSLQGLVNNVMPFSTNNNYFHWEPSSISLSSLGSHGFTTTQNENLHNFNVVPMSLPSGSHHQVLVCPSGVTTQPYFPSHGSITPLEFSSLTQPLYSLGQSVRPFPLSMTSMLLHSQNDSENQQSKNSTEFPLK